MHWCSKRAERSTLIALISPLIAIALTLVTMAILFAILGKNPVTALNVYFVEPLTDAYSLEEIAVKATPLVMIGDRPVALLSRQCLEYRRRGPVHRSARCAAAGSRVRPTAPAPGTGCCRRCWCSARSAARCGR